jgi:trehalose 6-phosphate phosphatase
MLPYLLTVAELGALFERLGYRFSEQSLRRCIDYYLQRTCHGSTLSAVVHTWVLARAGAPEALDFLTRALRSDIADVQGGTTAEGIHLGAMAGSVDLVQRCFAGVHMHAGTLWVEPLVVPGLGAVSTRLTYRGQPLHVQVTADHVRVSLGGDANAPVRCGLPGRIVEIDPGQTVEVRLEAVDVAERLTRVG